MIRAAHRATPERKRAVARKYDFATAHKRELATARKRRQRAREAHGLRPYTIEINEHDFALALILAKRLTAEQTLDRKRIEQALTEVVNEFCNHYPDDVTP